MKVFCSLRGKEKRVQGSYLTRRKGVLQVRHKLLRKFNCKQKNNTRRRKIRSMLGL